MFSARFDERDEDGKIIDEIQLYINSNIIQNLTVSDINNMKVR